MVQSRRALFLTLVLLPLAACSLRTAPAAIDTLRMKGGEEVQGSFEGYRTGRVVFLPREGKRIRQMLAKVEALELDPPVKVQIKHRGKGPGDARLMAYRKPEFILLHGSEEIRIRASLVTSIKPEMDLSRAMQHMEKEPAAYVDPDGSITNALEADVVNIVHFHMEGVVPSMRMGSYVRSLADKSRDQVRVVQITIDGWDAPVAVTNGITSIPQFWIYSPSGDLVRKLADSFTTADVDAAVKAARRASPSRRTR